MTPNFVQKIYFCVLYGLYNKQPHIAAKWKVVRPIYLMPNMKKIGHVSNVCRVQSFIKMNF